MQQIVEKILAFLARKILTKHRPKIIGITGSHGKTTTRLAIYNAIKYHYRTYTPLKNYNNLIGLPLGIIMVQSPGRSIFGWLVVFVKAFRMIALNFRYPEVLVLEYGIDRPGEMQKLLRIAIPDIAVLTAIGMSHIEYYDSQEQLIHEKCLLLEGVKQGGCVLVNANEHLAIAGASNVAAARSDVKFIRYGYFAKNEADVFVDNIETNIEKISTEIFVKTPSRLPSVYINAIGDSHAQAAVAAVAVCEVLQVPSETLQKGLLEYRPAPGRLSIIPGVKKSILIDDTYNSSPASTKVALELLSGGEIGNFFYWPWGTLKVFFFGDMLELGQKEKEEHEKIGKIVSEMKLDKFVCVGSRARFAGNYAESCGMSKDKIYYFADSADAAKKAQEFVEEGSVILIKGSQGARMERVTKELMAEPMKAKDLLCRQDEQWQAKEK